MSYIPGAELSISALQTLIKHTPLFVKVSKTYPPTLSYFVSIVDNYGHICIQTITDPSAADLGSHCMTEYNVRWCTFYEANRSYIDDPISHDDLEW